MLRLSALCLLLILLTFGPALSTVAAQPDPPHPTPPVVSLEASAECDGDDLVLTIRAGEAPFQLAGLGPKLPATELELGTHVFEGPATWEALLLVEYQADDDALLLGRFDCGTGEDIARAPQAALAARALSYQAMIRISTTQAQPAYDGPAGNIVRAANGAPLLLPTDADGNGFDTFVVRGAIEVDGEVWLALWLGGEQAVYVPASGVTPLAN